MSDLIKAAKEARENAYAPYSQYKVGAAVRSGDGRTWKGCNVENVSSPLGICAERCAVARMVSSGERKLREVAVVTRDGGSPCGGCLQVLLEFCDDPSQVDVHVVNEIGGVKTYRLVELIPQTLRPMI